jgi:hypothetical protein
MIEYINNVIKDLGVLDYITETVMSQRGWQIVHDHLYQPADSGFDTGKFSDTGFVLETFNKEPNSGFNPKINSFGDLIINQIFKQSRFIYENIVVTRYFWNYYNRSSTGTWHQDSTEFDPPGNYSSIVFYLNDSDGGTYVEKEFVQHKQNCAIIFDSKTMHRGVGPTTAKQRIALNVIFKYDSKKEQNGTSNRICL